MCAQHSACSHSRRRVLVASVEEHLFFSRAEDVFSVVLRCELEELRIRRETSRTSLTRSHTGPRSLWVNQHAHWQFGFFVNR